MRAVWSAGLGLARKSVDYVGVRHSASTRNAQLDEANLELHVYRREASFVHAALIEVLVKSNCRSREPSIYGHVNW
jgi:hypothetical protein